MDKPFRLQVFGKPGCDKCRALNQRLDTLLADAAWSDFEKEYCDVETEPGIIAFCEAECLNPQRIPALLVTRRDPESGTYRPVPNPRPGRASEAGASARLYTYLGLQTDYGPEGRGVISPRMLRDVLTEARAGCRN
jgi:hypothetical protein